jgi:hypothetical protein
MREIPEQLEFNFHDPHAPRTFGGLSKELKKLKEKWYGQCGWCGKKDTPIFCQVGSDGVCSDCFVTEVERRDGH